MKSLTQLSNMHQKEYSLENNKNSDDIINWFKSWIYEHHNSIDSWIFETYNEAHDNNYLITEDEFYWNKYQISSAEDLGWPHFVFWQELLYERLGQSIELNDKELDEIQNIKGVVSINIVHPNKKYKCKILYDNSIDSEKLISLMNFYGYSLDTYKQLNNDIYEAYFEAVNLKEFDYNYDYVYHITTKNKLEKIKKYGLIPKQKQHHNQVFNELDKRILEYPSKTYCFKEGIDKKTLLGFIGLQSILKNIPKRDFVCLKIDVKQYNLDRYPGKMKLMADPAYNSNDAMFTLEPIPTKYIEEIDIEDL